MPTSILIVKVYHYCRLAAQPRQCGTDGCRVDVTHQLADVLLLSTQRTVRFDAVRLKHGIEQFIIQLHAQQVGLLEREQLFTQLLQGDVFSLSCTFAGF